MSHFSHQVPIRSLMANKKLLNAKLSQMVTNSKLSDANMGSLEGNSK